MCPDDVVAEILAMREAERAAEAARQAAIAPPSPPRRATKKRLHGNQDMDRAHQRLRGIADKLAAALEGQRESLLNWGSYKLGAFVSEGLLTRDEVQAAMSSAAYACGWNTDPDCGTDPDKHIRGKIDHGLDDGANEPPDWDNDWRGTDYDAKKDAMGEPSTRTTQHTDENGQGEFDSAAPISLAQAHTVFRKWLGKDFDTDGLDAMLASVAVERFADGSDPVWLLLISGPGNAKTETVQSLDGIGAIVASSISSDAALLSATPRRERAKNATGGLLRKLGDRGVLVIKDVTSILSMDRTLRAKVLAALREVYDGRWTRDVGTDGGRTIPWTGRIAVIGAVTTAWDTAHSVIATMGDRFVLVRLDSTQHRIASGRQAIGNTGDEQIMREELAAAAAGVLAGMSDERITLIDSEIQTLLKAADLVTRARTGVEYDYKGDVIDAHAPEMPTRFAKQLAQIVRGAVALGMDRGDAMRLAIRCAKDSMPPLRLEIIEDLAVHGDSTSTDVRKRLKKPRATVDRQLQALHMLGLADLSEEAYGLDKIRWYYALSADVTPKVLK